MFVMRFDPKKIFLPELQPIMDRYFRGEMRADEVAKVLGWDRQQWNRAMAGIFSLAIQKHEGFSITEEAPP